MAAFSTKSLVILSVIILICAIIYKKRNDDMLKGKMEQVLRGLLRAEKKVGVDRNTRIALGFGGCEDIFVDAHGVLESMNLEVPADPVHVKDIVTQEDFMNIFTFFFKNGAAAE